MTLRTDFLLLAETRYPVFMPSDPVPSLKPPETQAEQRQRIVWEAHGIAKARASVAAGRLIDSEAIDAWIDSLGTDHELSPPPSSS